MSAKNRKKPISKDKVYSSKLRSLPEDALEELLIELEKSTSDYLKRILPPKTDFNIALSIAKKSDSVDVSAEVIVRGRIEHWEDYSKLAQDAINYVKEMLTSLLEARKQHEE